MGGSDEIFAAAYNRTMDFSFSPSPLPEVPITKYAAARFPKFQHVFEPNGQLSSMSQAPEDADLAVVIENLADKDITALRYRWTITLMDRSIRTSTCSSDSYMIDVFRPVLKRQDRKLITRTTHIDESLIDHLLGGGGVIGGRISNRSTITMAALHFELDMILFEDGEFAGPDRTKHAFELQSRKPAAEFVAKQIRLAEADGRDVTSVLSALAEVPHLRDDFLADCTQDYARDFLRHMHDDRQRTMRLRHLENRPTLPKFYRREK